MDITIKTQRYEIRIFDSNDARIWDMKCRTETSFGRSYRSYLYNKCGEYYYDRATAEDEKEAAMAALEVILDRIACEYNLKKKFAKFKLDYDYVLDAYWADPDKIDMQSMIIRQLE